LFKHLYFPQYYKKPVHRKTLPPKDLLETLMLSFIQILLFLCTNIASILQLIFQE